MSKCHSVALVTQLSVISTNIMSRSSLILVIISAVLLRGGLDTLGQQKNSYETLYVSSGEAFILHQNQSAIINKDIEIRIVHFHNSPCPEYARCVWSGVGIDLEYYHNGEVKKGINLVQAFGYQTTILETDHETYAKLEVNKL